MANERTVPLNGIDLHYEIDGAGDPPSCFCTAAPAVTEIGPTPAAISGLREYQLIAPDARGHGQSTNPQKTLTHRQCALDTLALLDHLGVGRCQAIGVSMGGNILLHMATLQPGRI